MIYNTILDAIGHTPLIRLNRMTGENDAEILVKYEGVNIGVPLLWLLRILHIRANC